jgi:DNA-binding MarR family transcriptional regulator
MDIKKNYRPYTPSRQDEAFLECTTSGRKQLLDDLFSSIRAQCKKPTHQHWMLFGPRGIGKSHIITLLHHKIKNTPELNSKWLTILFPEEAAGIISLRDFMDKTVSLSNELLEKEGFSDQANEFKDLNKRIHEQKNDRKAINQIRSYLIDWKDKNQRKILILLENADRVIGSRIAKNLKDEKWLRDLLMNHDLFLIIGTSPTFFDHVINKDHPLYELFRVEVLEDLSFDESLELLINYAQAEKRTDLVHEFKTKTNRIEAIYTLTGGNPRLLIMLYILIQDSVRNIDEVETGFYNLLEELTPYFQYRLGQLAGKEEKILVAFAEGPELLTPAEVGRKIRMATNVVTANLKRLQQAGFIKRIEKPIKGRKGTLYRLSETIYRYWYQMNSERNREMADIFVRFIVLYYTYKELNQIYSFRKTEQVKNSEASIGLSESSRDKQYIEKALEEAKYIESERLIGSIQKAKDEGRPANEIAANYQELVELHPDDLNILNQYAIFLIQLGKIKEAINYFQEITELADEAGHKEYQYGGYLNWGNALSY